MVSWGGNALSENVFYLFWPFSFLRYLKITHADWRRYCKARAGIYSLERVEKLPPETLKRFFLKGTGKNNGFVQVRKELRDLISFRTLNLLDEQWPLS